LYNDGYVVKELSQVGLTSYHAKEDVHVGESSISSFINNRSGSGFFSTFSNVLPAFFSLSSSPEKTPPSSPDKDTTLADNSPPQSVDIEGVEDAKNSPVTSTHSDNGNSTQQGQESNFTTCKPPQSALSSTIIMGNERTTINLANGQDTTDNSGGNLEEGFVEVPASASTTQPTIGTTSGSAQPANGSAQPANGRTTQPQPASGSKGSPNTAGRRGTVEGSGTDITDASGNLTTEDPNPEPPSEIDVQLFLKLNSYLKTIEDQLRKPAAKKLFEARLEPYAPYALAEFNQHLARYHQWELKNEEPPRFMSLPFARMGEG